MLKEPRLIGVPLGSKEYFETQRALIAERPLLRHCYDTWYREMLAPHGGKPFRAGATIELGSGGSLLKAQLPSLITSDVVEGVADRVIDARQMPFEDASLQAIFMSHTFHHIPECHKFLAEAERTLQPGGYISMIEVAHTPFARFFFDKFHPEPYDDSPVDWVFSQQDSMRDSNQALSWMVFVRDRARFEREFPSLCVESIGWLPWFVYLVSGGVTMRDLIPGFLVQPLIGLEWLLSPLRPLFSLHWHIIVRKRS